MREKALSCGESGGWDNSRVASLPPFISGEAPLSLRVSKSAGRRALIVCRSFAVKWCAPVASRQSSRKAAFLASRLMLLDLSEVLMIAKFAEGVMNRLAISDGNRL